MQKSLIEKIPLPPTDALQNVLSVATWLAGNCIALAIAAGRVPLSARYPQPAEALTAHVVVAVQVILAALLAPTLLSRCGMVVFVAVSGAAFVELAGVLAQVPQRQILMVITYGAIWIGGISVSITSLPFRWKSPLHSTLALATLLGPLLLYLSIEANQKNLAGNAAQLLPVLSGLTLIDISHFEIRTWVVVFLPSAPGILYLTTMKIRRRRHLNVP